MSYEEHDFQQGSDEWIAHRGTCYNASELAAAAGESTNTTRSFLIECMSTGREKEFSDYVLERVIKPGHRFEALARPLAEALIGEELYSPALSMAVPGLARRLGASLDGKTMDDSTNWEHKRLNADLAASLDQGIIPPKYHWQMEQGMMINRATRCLFSASDWKPAPGDEIEDGCIYGTVRNEDGDLDRYVLIDIKHVWYESNPELRAKIIPTWKQVEEDAANYKHVEVIPAAVAAPTLDLPAISIQTIGSITIRSNLRAFGEALNSFIDRLPAKPSTDQEFADCKAALGKLKAAEQALDSEENRALTQISEVDEMRREKKMYRDLTTTTRLALEKIVTARESAIKFEIMQDGKDKLAAHMAALNKRLGRVMMPPVNVDFAAAIKGKRTVDSLRNAVDTTLANAKIYANDIADRIQINLAALDEHKEHTFLFNDVSTLVLKAPDDLSNVIKLRIAEHAAEQQKKLDAERERIRKEEQERADREAAAKVAAEQKAAKEAADKAEAERKAAEAVIAKGVDESQTQAAQLIQPISMQASEVHEQAIQNSIQKALARDARPQSDSYISRNIEHIVFDLLCAMDTAEKTRVLRFCECLVANREVAA